jgi:predicted TPR repeat methyltransferase
MKPHARRLIGIDLSAGMLSIARQRSIYDELIHLDVVDYLRDCNQRFDLVAASDVLTYIGDVSEFFRHTARVLRPTGIVAVATEALKTSGDYCLNLSGRFSHSREYLEDAMNSAGITVASLEERVMRHEAGKPVSTWVAVGKCCGQ